MNKFSHSDLSGATVIVGTAGADLVAHGTDINIRYGLPAGFSRLRTALEHIRSIEPSVSEFSFDGVVAVSTGRTGRSIVNFGEAHRRSGAVTDWKPDRHKQDERRIAKLFQKQAEKLRQQFLGRSPSVPSPALIEKDQIDEKVQLQEPTQEAEPQPQVAADTPPDGTTQPS